MSPWVRSNFPFWWHFPTPGCTPGLVADFRGFGDTSRDDGHGAKPHGCSLAVRLGML